MTSSLVEFQFHRVTTASQSRVIAIFLSMDVQWLDLDTSSWNDRSHGHIMPLPGLLLVPTSCLSKLTFYCNWMRWIFHTAATCDQGNICSPQLHYLWHNQSLLHVFPVFFSKAALSDILKVGPSVLIYTRMDFICMDRSNPGAISAHEK